MTDARALFDVFWTVEQKHPLTAKIELRRARTIFNISPIDSSERRKSYTQYSNYTVDFGGALFFYNGGRGGGSVRLQWTYKDTK